MTTKGEGASPAELRKAELRRYVQENPSASLDDVRQWAYAQWPTMTGGGIRGMIMRMYPNGLTRDMEEEGTAEVVMERVQVRGESTQPVEKKEAPAPKAEEKKQAKAPAEKKEVPAPKAEKKKRELMPPKEPEKWAEVSHTCPRCQRSATGAVGLTELFGWRYAGTRVQSQCRKCRADRSD